MSNRVGLRQEQSTAGFLLKRAASDLEHLIYKRKEKSDPTIFLLRACICYNKQSLKLLGEDGGWLKETILT
jgi:hypothetical protein